LIGKEAEADGSAKSPAYLRINPQVNLNDIL
jgi:hypothetical protein